MMTCEKCLRSMDENNFYTYRDGAKVEMCKKCMTMHINNFDPSTYLWLLEKMDVPYIPGEWISLRDKAYAKDPKKMNGMSVFGKYLCKMKLKQWKDYRWEDTERLAAEAELKEKEKAEAAALAEKEMQQKFEEGKVSEAQFRTMTSTATQISLDNERIAAEFAATEVQNNPYNENRFVQEEILPDLSSELDEEDKKYLLMKWGRLYSPNEWIELEKMYSDMTSSFDIQDADTQNTLLFICKTNLKMNYALDTGDIETFQKLSKVSESLRKSAKFTAAQNKEQKEDFVDCVGNLVAYCEKQGGQIPKYKIETNLDIVDKVIQDMKNYTKSLINEDQALARQIEDYLKKREIAEQQKRDREEAKMRGNDTVILNDNDFKEYYDDIIKQKEDDENTLMDGDDE